MMPPKIPLWNVKSSVFLLLLFSFRKSCGSEVASHSCSNLNNIRSRARNPHKPFFKLVLAFFLCLLNLTSSCGGANDKVLEKWNRIIGDSFISINTECEAI